MGGPLGPHSARTPSGWSWETVSAPPQGVRWDGRSSGASALVGLGAMLRGSAALPPGLHQMHAQQVDHHAHAEEQPRTGEREDEPATASGDADDAQDQRRHSEREHPPGGASGPFHGLLDLFVEPFHHLSVVPGGASWWTLTAPRAARQRARAEPGSEPRRMGTEAVKALTPKGYRSTYCNTWITGTIGGQLETAHKALCDGGDDSDPARRAPAQADPAHSPDPPPDAPGGTGVPEAHEFDQALADAFARSQDRPAHSGEADFGPDEHLAEAHRAGEISTSEAVSYGLASLTAPETVPEELRPTGTIEDPERYLAYLSAQGAEVGGADNPLRQTITAPEPSA